jgi:hypothetical protein
VLCYHQSCSAVGNSSTIVAHEVAGRAPLSDDVLANEHTCHAGDLNLSEEGLLRDEALWNVLGSPLPSHVVGAGGDKSAQANAQVAAVSRKGHALAD